jgi:hypothetical protein
LSPVPVAILAQVSLYMHLYIMFHVKHNECIQYYCVKIYADRHRRILSCTCVRSGWYMFIYIISPGVLYARAMSWLPELCRRLPVAGGWLTRTSTGLSGNSYALYNIIILYTGLSPYAPFVKISYFPAIAGCWLADSCWLVGAGSWFLDFIMFTIVLRSSIIVNIITRWCAGCW